MRERTGERAGALWRRNDKRMENVYPTLWCCPSCTAPSGRPADGRGVANAITRGLKKGDRSEIRIKRETGKGASAEEEEDNGDAKDR